MSPNANVEPRPALPLRPVNSGLVVVAASQKTGSLHFRGKQYDCALGRGGIINASAKREGDEFTPAGLFHFERLYYRPDRLDPPETALPRQPITPELGWCDDPADAAYNQAVKLPYRASAESLWRDDGVYDLLVTISHNRNPVKPGRGSAIFLHIARPDLGPAPRLTPTRGCIALKKPDLLSVVAGLGPASMVRIEQCP